jgi:hypothetical protein
MFGFVDLVVESEPLAPPRRVLLVVNPFGGTKQAPDVCQRIVRPLLERAGAEIRVICAFDVSSSNMHPLIKKFDSHDTCRPRQ